VRRLVLHCLLLLVVAGSAATIAAHASTGSSIDLTEAGGAAFPTRAFVIGLPAARRSLTPADVSVTENGAAVTGVTLVPAQLATKQTFGTVLLLDTSDSMAGEPVKGAFAAAQAFAARRAPNQQLAIVTFNDATKVALPFTTSKQQIDAALSARPSIAYGTHIYDAVAQAESLLADAHVQAGSIVVLSDGADTGSTATAASVTATARANHVKLFTIGLRDKRFNGSALLDLAHRGGGEYASASSSTALASLFDQLGERLAREYLLHYQSLVGPDVPVRVHVTVAGVGSAGAAYRTPALPTSVPAPYQASLTSRILGSWIAMLLVAALAAGAVLLLLTALVQPKRSGLPARMAEFVSVPGLQTQERQAKPETPSWVDRLDLQLEIAQIKMSATTLVTMTAAATALAVLILAVAFGSPWWGLLGLLIPFVVREVIARKLARRRLQFAEQLPDSLQVIAAALRAGHSFAGALAVVVERANEPMRTEMQTVVADEQRGIPLESAIDVVVERMQNRDLEQVALVAQLQRDSGGNAAEVVDRVAETIRERFELRRLVKTLTVQGRMSRWIVTALPIGLVVLLTLINPHYLHPLVSNLFGKVLIVFALLLVVSGSFVIKKIVDIKV
jgi:tight adherence protein B